MKTESIFDVIEFSGIRKETLKAKLDETRKKASTERAHQLFSGRLSSEEIATHWFKNWLHPALKHRTALPNPQHYDFSNPDEQKEFRELLFQHTYENGQQNFSYTLEDIDNYIRGGEKQ